MVVEDDAELRSLLARGLDEEGFEVRIPDADGRDVCHAFDAMLSTRTWSRS